LNRHRLAHDEVIFEEFKGTGNMEIILDRKLVTSASSQPSTSSAPAPARKSCFIPRRICSGSGFCAGAQPALAGRGHGVLISRLEKVRNNAGVPANMNQL